MRVTVPLGAFLPDAPDYQNPGLTVCDNVYALNAGYKPIPSFVATSNVVDEEVRGGARYITAGAEPVIIIGTVADLYVIRGSMAILASGLGLALDGNQYWTFSTQGKSIYATAPGVGLYRLTDIGVDNTFAVSTGSPPVAAYVATFDDFLFLGNMTDIDASEQPYRVRWSAFNNPTEEWITDIGNQSGYVDMPSEFGQVTGLSGGRTNLIFQENGISRIWYTGGATVFNKDVVEDRRGCSAPRSIAQVGGSVYFLADDGFSRTDGADSVNIAAGRVWDWFLDNSNAGTRDLTSAAVDWENASVVWSFVGANAAFYTRQIIYNWVLDRWTTGTVETQMLIESNISAVSIDEDDPSVVDDYLLDVEGPSFDSPIYTARGRTLMAIDQSGQIMLASGQPRAATFETGDLMPSPGQRSLVRSVEPVIDYTDGEVQIQMGTRARVGETKVFGSASTVGPLGFAPVMSDARLQSIRISAPLGTQWSKATDYILDYIGSGIA